MDDLDAEFLKGQRIIDWIRDELLRARDGNDTVSVGDAYRIAFTACEKTLRAVGGL